MFRRPRFRPDRKNIFQNIPPALKHAQQLMSLGRFEEAAVIFEQLAHGAHQRGLEQDARLFMTAGHCRVKANQIELAMSNFRQGLQIISLRGNKLVFQRACQRTVRELNEMGYAKEANQIFEEVLKTATISSSNDLNHEKDRLLARGTLPAACPACGGSLRSDVVEWIDDSTAECSWCGASVITIR